MVVKDEAVDLEGKWAALTKDRTGKMTEHCSDRTWL